MNKITKLIKRLSQKKYIKLIYLSFISSMFLIKNPFFGEGRFKEITNGVKLIHSNFYNSYEDILKFFATIGLNGLKSYTNLLLIDFIVIISSFLFQSILIRRLLSIIKKEEKLKILLILPLAKSLVDIIENLALILSLKCPNVTFLISIAQIAIPIKWIFFTLTLFALTSLIFIVLLKRINSSRHSRDKTIEKNIKILAINGSHKKSGGVNQLLIDSIFKGAQKKGADVETVRLSSVNINNCISCNKCQRSNEYTCVYDDKDDFINIYNKILEADILIYATPIYIFNISGLMKNFMDRMYSRGKCQENIFTKSNLLFHDVEKQMLNKKFISIITADNIECKTTESTVSFFNSLATFFDYSYIGSFVRNGTYIFKDNVKHKYKDIIEEILSNLEIAGEFFATNKKLPTSIVNKVNKSIIPIPVTIFNLLKKSNVGRVKLLEKINAIR